LDLPASGRVLVFQDDDRLRGASRWQSAKELRDWLFRWESRRIPALESGVLPGCVLIGEAMKLQRPLPDGALRIVARGLKMDDGAMVA